MLWTRPWSSKVRPASLSLLLVGALPAACGASSPADPPPGNSGGPSLISFGTNVTALTDGESVRFVALATDPTGVDSLVGGQLTSADGAIKYGAFGASQQGAYSLDLSWSQINQAKQIAFAEEEKRTFIAEFFNAAGQRTQQTIELRFHCRGQPACEGRCTNAGSLCPVSTDKLCIAGVCSAGCYVNQEFTAADAMSSAEACKVCKTATSRTALQTLPDYAPCKPGLACGDGRCEVPFAKVDPKTTSTLYSVSSPSATFQIAVGSLGAAVRTMDGGATWASITPGSDTLRGVFALNTSDIYAVGSSATLYKSSNGGTSWTKQNTTLSTTTTLYGVWASGPNDVWAVGASGSIVRSSDGGTTWIKLTPPASTTLNAVWGSGPNDVYFAGEGGTVWRTTSSGASFTPLLTNVTNSLTGIWGSGADNVYVVGSSGTVLRTTNSGTSFSKMGTPDSSTTLYGVWGSGTSVYFVGSSGTVWRTLDGAAITAVPSASISTLYGISGTGERAFTIVGSFSSLRRL